GNITFPYAKPATQVHHPRKATGMKETHKTVHAATNLDAHETKPADLSSHLREHWTVEAQHHIRDRTFAENASTAHAGNTPHTTATLRNLTVSALTTLGTTNTAKTTRAIHNQPEQAPLIPDITPKHNLNRT
ncbi:ISAs1 family transposase, partial [Streptomyces sp. NPDC026665]